MGSYIFLVLILMVGFTLAGLGLYSMVNSGR
jgi:hypothetical protein